MNVLIRRASVILVLAAFAAGLSGCNTMRGVGRDTAVVGEKIEEEAERHIDEDEQDDQPAQSSGPGS